MVADNKLMKALAGVLGFDSIVMFQIELQPADSAVMIGYARPGDEWISFAIATKEHLQRIGQVLIDNAP